MMFRFVLFALCLIFFVEHAFCFEANDLKVKTSSGLVKGNTLTVLNQTINQFLGIPYAEPPLGKLRFAKPQPLKNPLEGIIDGTQPKHSCFQMKHATDNPEWTIDNENEDCLVLNVWSPELPENGTESPLKTVMFWIYGGGFTQGSIFQLLLYDGRVLATNDVVVVTANYRVGTFGFLYGGEESAPGNMGLYDQLLALKWVRENIHLFGGDSNKITIFGESAGSMSVSALILSPLSRNLFQRAILESGSTFGYKNRGFVTKDEALIETKEMSKSFNCTDDNQWLDCLRKVDAQKMNSYLKIHSTPIFGTEFLPLLPQNALKAGNFTKGIQILTGVTGNEGTALAYSSFSKLRETKLNKTDLADLVKLVSRPGVDIENVTKFYFSNIDPNNKTALILAFGSFFGDIIITCPTYFFAEQFATYSPKDSVYFYEFTYRRDDPNARGTEWMGSGHGGDIEFVFGVPFIRPEVRTENDRNFSKLVMNLWTNFAKNGKPLSDNSSIQWPTLRKSANSEVVSSVMELDPIKFGHILDKPFSNCDGFWKQYFI